MMPEAHDPHSGQAILQLGPSATGARLVSIVLHGRGASAEDILGFAQQLGAKDVCYLAPQAAGHSWYPHSFLAPIQQNEPHLSSALRLVSTLIDDLERRGVPASRIVLMGFSQGACLSLEYAARHARRYAAIAALSGGIIGPAVPPGTPRDYEGSFEGTPVFLGCSDVDPHIPVERVHETAEVFRRMSAVVDERIYPRMGHTINRDELEAVAALLGREPPSV